MNMVNTKIDGLQFYVDPDMMELLGKFSKKRGVEVSTIVNEWIKKDISIVETVLAK